MSCQFPLCKRHPESNGYCIGHRIYSGTPVVKPAKPIPVRSEKQKGIMKELAKLYKIFLSKPGNQKCKAGFDGCTKVATEIHHSKGRIGANATDVTTFIPLCHSCHRLVEENPQQAKELGLSKPRLKKSA